MFTYNEISSREHLAKCYVIYLSCLGSKADYAHLYTLSGNIFGLELEFRGTHMSRFFLSPCPRELHFIRAVAQNGMWLVRAE